MNWIKKLIKKNHENFKKMQSKKYHSKLWLFAQTTLPAFAYAIILCLQSIIDNSAPFSIALAFFSCCVTIAFERNEWIIFTQNDNAETKKYKYFTPLLRAFIFTMIVSFTFYRFAPLIRIPEKIIQILPNFITSLTLLGYFVSYTFRSYKIILKEYSTK